MTSLQYMTKKILLSAIDAVTPFKLVTNALHRCGNILTVNGKEYTLKQNVHVVGFGKAVYGMALGLQSILDEHIVSGVISVPHGSENIILNSSMIDNKKDTKIKVMKGARNNLPDIDAVQSAIQIKHLVQSLCVDDILLVLTSGGGSALLPAPVKEISLQDKLTTIKLVSNAGGTIQQLNTVRKKLSELKGGKLAALCPSLNIVTLVISDIVKNPLDLIASGPTVFDTSTFQDCLNIFTNLSISDKIPYSVLDYITKNLQNKKQLNIVETDLIRRCNNLIVGSNTILVNEAVKKTSEYDFLPYVITTQLEGDATEIGCLFADLAVALLLRKQDDIITTVLKLDSSFNVNPMLSDVNHKVKLCVITAGETTVRVTGTGKGGRNQHLVLSTISRLKQISIQHPHIDLHRICLLSAGTDGQDGPTDAAGAFCAGDLIDYIIKKDVDVDKYLNNNSSYEFFSEHLAGSYLLKTGLTGTNVMDIELLMVDLS